MAGAFDFNACQYVDFTESRDDDNLDAYFEVNKEPALITTEVNLHGQVIENDPSDNEGDSLFFSPLASSGGPSTSNLFLRGQIRRSLSMGHIAPPIKSPEATQLQVAMDNLDLHEIHPKERSRSTQNLAKTNKGASQESINRLAQPKRYKSQDNLTLAEGVKKFQQGTPKRFRSRASPQLSKPNALPWHGARLTKPQTPKFATTQRYRPPTTISHAQLEEKQMQEAKRHQIKANPVNKRILKGPMKAVPLEKKPPTAMKPFHLTEVKKKEVKEEPPMGVAFHAQPVPKSMKQPFKTEKSAQLPTEAHTPNFSNRFCKRASPRAKSMSVEGPKEVVRPSRTIPIPFSFEKRDSQVDKKKEDLFNKIVKEERKAREFHAKPLPKCILRSKNGSFDQLDGVSVSRASRASSVCESDSDHTFRAKPALVLHKKPFIPKHDDSHVMPICEFQFATENRSEARHKYEMKLREKEEEMELIKKQREEQQHKLEDEEVMRLRKEAEHKAQPIKRFKPVHIVPSAKVTEPISPKFHERIRNKENIENF